MPRCRSTAFWFASSDGDLAFAGLLLGLFDHHRKVAAEFAHDVVQDSSARIAHPRILRRRAGRANLNVIGDCPDVAGPAHCATGGASYPLALEAALKIKEVSYIYAEGFAGGELKHGVIALIEEGTPWLVLAPRDATFRGIISGAHEIKARGGFIIGVSPDQNDVWDEYIPVADVPHAAALVNAVPPQLLAYHLALLRGLDPDMPRNLAKSVAVK